MKVTGGGEGTENLATKKKEKRKKSNQCDYGLTQRKAPHAQKKAYSLDNMQTDKRHELKPRHKTEPVQKQAHPNAFLCFLLDS